MRAVNLIPAGERRGAPVGAGRSGGAAYIVLGALGVLALLFVLYGHTRHQVSDRQSQLATIAAQTQRAQESASALAPYTTFAALREQRTKAVEQVVDSRFDWAHAFHELGRVLPRDASISSLDGTVGSGSASTPASTTSSTASAAAGATSATPPGSVPTITLGGCATSQAEVALTLQRLRLMDGVGSVNLQSSAKSTAGGGSSGASSSANCVAGSATFTVQITFDPLPTPTPTSSSSSTNRLTASTGGGK
ncbi:MAG TPA: hypothetical protein VK774_04680 [Solirubrobacteraceae bacterium]|jgi:hypothetical protein|nr:hypothetical protein [Solirubrobacteraceae bacterium]